MFILDVFSCFHHTCTGSEYHKIRAAAKVSQRSVNQWTRITQLSLLVQLFLCAAGSWLTSYYRLCNNSCIHSPQAISHPKWHSCFRMSKLERLNARVAKLLTGAVQEVLEVVKETVSEYQQRTARTQRENESLRRRLQELQDKMTIDSIGG